MTSYFSQIQYVPDPITGERINVGVVAIDPTGCKFQFTHDWKRASAFGGENIDFLREFADEALSTGENWFTLMEESSAESLSRALGRWHNKIQFSAPMPSIKNRDDLLADVAPRLLHIELPSEEKAARHVGRGRERAVTLATKSLGAAMREKFGRVPRGLVKRDLTLKGKIESYPLDVGLQNGALYGGAFALSFETGSPKSHQRETDGIAFALDDLMKEQPDTNLAVIVLPPNPVTASYQRAEHVFKSIRATMLVERQLSNWAAYLVSKISEDAIANHDSA